MELAEIQRIVEEVLQELLTQDISLIKNDVSERAITHKFAEHLQKKIPDLNVDCEYNRNYVEGPSKPKSLYLLDQKTQELKNDLEVGELLAVSAYPDVIIHQRLTNKDNLLVVEVKKQNSKVPHDHDVSKLKAFTENTAQNSYNFEYGVFIVLETGVQQPRDPILQWFSGGKQID